MSTLITYKISSDRNEKLKSAAKLSCGFWNRFVNPSTSIVIRLGTFTRFGSTIARAYKPYSNNGVTYGRVEFNTRHLRTFSENEIVGTIIHEIGHTLGYGWDRWMDLFDSTTGRFLPEYIEAIPELSEMEVETDYGPGTTLAHWDEQKFGAELMTGLKNPSEHIEYVLPVTIKVISLLGHQVAEELHASTPLNDLIDALREVQFTRRDDAREIDRDYFEDTELWEEIYTDKRHPL